MNEAWHHIDGRWATIRFEYGSWTVTYVGSRTDRGDMLARVSTGIGSREQARREVRRQGFGMAS